MKIEPKSSFDECFQTFPRLRSPKNLTDVWKSALAELKKTPVDPRQKLMLKKSLGWETMMDVNYLSFGNQRVRGVLSVPRKRGKVPAVISFHDYHSRPETVKGFADHGIAHLAVELREHEQMEEQPRVTAEGQPAGPPPYFHKYGLTNLEKSYPYACFLDAIRSIDFIRLHKGVDPSRIGVLGHGFGAAMAIFASVQRDDVRALALERPGLIWMEGYLQESNSDAANEIRAMMGRSTHTKNKIKKALDYLDMLNWAEIIDKPVLVAAGLKDELNTPRSAFAFFNHMKTDKSMELFPDELADPDGVEQRKKSIAFSAEDLKS